MKLSKAKQIARKRWIESDYDDYYVVYDQEEGYQVADEYDLDGYYHACDIIWHPADGHVNAGRLGVDA